MRLLVLLSTLLTALAAPALAHDTHGPCSTSKSLTRGPVHVDVYSRDCLGVTATTTAAWCRDNDPHVFMGIHTPVLNGEGCETGVLWSPLESGLLP